MAEGRALFNRLVAVVAVLGFALAGAPTASGQETITVHDFCSLSGNQAYMKLGTAGVGCSSSPSVFVTTAPVSVFLPRWFPGAYPVDPANPWSDWVLPNGR